MTVAFRGTTDTEYVQLGGATVTTTSGRFRGLYVPCALSVNGGNSMFWENIPAYSLSTLWFSARGLTGVGGNTSGQKFLVFLDGSFNERIRIVGTGTNGRFRVEKVTAAAVATQLGSDFIWFPSITSGVTDKIDVYINDNASGTIDIYINRIHVFTYSGDTTTDGVSTLARHWLGATLNGFPYYWSETFVTDFDTRSKNLQLLAPVANGTNHNFDTGSPSAANINEISVDDTTLNGSTTATQVDGYTIPNLVTGTFAVLDFALSFRAQKGSSGPTKIAPGLRISGTDYYGSDQAQDLTWGNTQYGWSTNPATSAPFTPSDINAAGFNIQLKSVA